MPEISKEISFTRNIDGEDSLFRYMSLAQFLSIIENEELVLKKVTLWEDTWEALDKQIPVKKENGELTYANCTLADSVVGQCWTYEKDSDAMWRIYSPDKQGVMIETKAKNFKIIKDLRLALLAKVKYFNNNNFISKNKEITDDRSYKYAGTMVLKREAFKHENEVRLLVCMQPYIQDKGINPWELETYAFNINPIDFIESITFDPRADEWFVRTIEKYCNSKGFRCPIAKSKLYEKTFFEDVGVAVSYVPVKRTNA